MGPSRPKEATWDDAVAEAKNGGCSLITTEELAVAYSKDPKAFLLVDARQEWEYRSGHIKGAVNFPMEPTWWARWRKGGSLKELLGSDKNRTIVFY
jgi:rhodanese-related sulfurtransferase